MNRRVYKNTGIRRIWYVAQSASREAARNKDEQPQGYWGRVLALFRAKLEPWVLTYQDEGETRVVGCDYPTLFTEGQAEIARRYGYVKDGRIYRCKIAPLAEVL